MGYPVGTSGRLQPALDKTSEQRGPDGQNGVIDNEAGIVGRDGSGMTEREKRPRRVKQHVGEIFAAHGTPGCRGHPSIPENLATYVGHDVHVIGMIGQHREDVPDVDVYLDLVGRGDVVRNGLQPGPDQLPDLVGKSSYRAADAGYLGNDVVGRAAVDLCHGKDRRFGRSDIPADDRLQRLNKFGNRRDRIARDIGMGAMRSPALEDDIEEIGARKNGSRRHVQMIGGDWVEL